MEELFKNNIFFVYLLACIAIYNYGIFTKRQRVLIIYLMSYGLAFFRIVESWKIIVLLTVVLFILEEYLNTDIGKIELIKKMKYKIVDFIYYAICQYSIIYIFIALALNSNNCLWKIEERKMVSFIIFIVAIQKLNNPKFELNTFTSMKKKFDEFAFGYINLSNDDLFEKMIILSEIEDKSYFYRDKTYNFLSKQFLEYKIKINKSNNDGRGNSFSTKRVIMKISKDFKEGLVLRGYSTIEMQLIKNIGIKRGVLRKKYLFTRKIYELIYTKIFFSGLRAYYESNQYGKIEYFKKFIIYIYLHNVPTTINGKRYSKFVDAFNGKKIEEISMNAMFVACLGLNTRRIYKERVQLYAWMFKKHDLNMEKILYMAAHQDELE